jgi:hypothetical protein
VILALLALVLVVAALAARYLALPRPKVLRAARDAAAVVRAGSPYAYQYQLVGGDDHDEHKVVVRADARKHFILVRTAPVDRQGRRTGRARFLGITR